MEITTKETTKKLQYKIADNFLGIAEQLRSEGRTDNEIVGIFNAYKNAEIRKFYRDKNKPEILRKCIARAIDQKPDSKIEGIFYYLIDLEKIPFQFQYKIGPYRIDFLIDGFLILEIDGPQHSKQIEYDVKRDSYLRKMGYKILRVPAWLVAMDPKAVIKEIKERRNERPQISRGN